MKKTDYSKISGKYDRNKFRQDIKIDMDMKEYIDANPNSRLRFLDLSCGTGIYLSEQMKYFGDAPVEWHGLDASSDMLDRAKSKTCSVQFTESFAEKLPYESHSFDFISNNYAFHHYQDKHRALDEISRVIKKDGIYKMHNIAIHDMKKWWIYEFFPSAYFEDTRRFWDKELIFCELASRGFDVKVRMDYKMECTKIAELMDYALNRDISVLTLISDDEYKEGLENMKYKIFKNPEAIVFNDFAEIFFIAKKSKI